MHVIKVRSTPIRSLLFPIVSLLLGITLMIGCAESDETKDTDPNENQAEYTDVELFTGLVFGQGPVAKKVPIIQEHWAPHNYIDDSERLRELRNFNRRIAEAVAEEHPEFIANFQKAVRSGDRTEIKTALNRGALVSVQVVSQMEEVQKIRKQLRENPDQAKQIVENSREFEQEHFTEPREQSVEQLQQAIDQFEDGDFNLDEIPKPLNVDYATYCYLYRHATVANIQHFFRDYAVVIDSDIDLSRIYLLPDLPVLEGQDQDYRLLHEQTIDGIAQEFAG
jgi:SdpC family antimicrobial peptide